MKHHEHRTRLSLVSLVLVSAGALPACSEDGTSSDPSSGGNPPVAAAGAGGASGSGGQGNEGTAASAGAAGSALGGRGGTDAGAAGSSALTLDPQPACSSPAVACNGACLQPGATANGCAYVTRVQSLSGLIASDGDAFASLSFPITALGVTPPPAGLYCIDGGTLALTQLDTASNVSAIVASDETVYYMKPGTIADGFIRSVPIGGGAPMELLTGIEDGSGLWLTEGRLYFSAALPADNGSASVHWLPLDGSAGPQTTALTNSSRARFNQTLVAASFNGNIKTAPLPDLTPVTQVMSDFALPVDQWWLDEQYIYWNKGGSYKRSPLSAVGSTEANGELVTSLPPGMSVQLDVGSELFLAATVGGVTGFFVMPVSGGAPTQLAVVGIAGPKLRAADHDHVYIETNVGLLRVDR